MDPRAAAGTLEELVLVAAFTKVVMEGPGGCAGNDANRKGSRTRIADDLVFPRHDACWKSPPLFS